MNKKLSLLLSAIIGCAGALSAESFKEVMDCHKNILSVQDVYRPEGGYFLCGKDACFLAYEDGSAYRLTPAKHPTFSVNEIFLDASSARAVHEHRLSSWKEPRSDKTVFVDIISRDGRVICGKFLTSANENSVDALALEKVDPTPAADIALKSVERNLDLMKSNIEKRSFPPGWDEVKYKGSVLSRISGCAWNEKAQKLKALAEGLTQVP